MTGIANRRFFEEFSDREWKRAQRDKQPFTVVMIDLDCFKAYNDTYGHQRGDESLKAVAKILKDSMKRPSDLAARYGGEEFIVILPDTSKKGGYELAEKLRKKVLDLKLEHKNNICGNEITVSVGVAMDIAEPGKKLYDLIDKADKALYEAKNSGRNQTLVYESKN